MSKHEFYKMEWEAWDEGTDSLSLMQEAAYLRLCHQMYRRQGPIPNDVHLHVRLFRVHHNTARALVQQLLALGKIALNDDGEITQGKVVEVLEQREARSKVAAVNGRKGGRPKSSSVPHDPGITPASVPHHLGMPEASAGDHPGTGTASVPQTSNKPLENNGAQKPFAFIDETQSKPIREDKSREEKNRKKDAVEGDGAQDVSRETIGVTLDPTKELFTRGKRLLGANAGGVISKLLKAKNHNAKAALAAIVMAEAAQDPREYIGRIIAGNSTGGASDIAGAL
jgi:uncharacterized protein YdaU (DUF1376 family)